MKLPRVLFLRADLKGTELELRRIANALDEIVLREYGIPMQATPKPKEDDSDVLYTDDRQQFVQELKDVVAMRRPDRPIDVDDEDLQ